MHRTVAVGVAVLGSAFSCSIASAQTADPIYANSFESGLIAFSPGINLLPAPSSNALTVNVPLQVTLSAPSDGSSFVTITSADPSVVTAAGGGVLVPMGQTTAPVLLNGIAGSASSVTLTATLGNTIGAGVRVEESLNETGTGAEADYCVLQAPLAFDVFPGAPAPPVYGRLYEALETPGGGAAPGWTAQVGYGPLGSDPRDLDGWKFLDASYNAMFIDANNDEYQAQFEAPAGLGDYSYAYRFSKNAGASFTYCDTDGAGSNPGLTFSAAALGVMSVKDPYAGLVINEVDYDNIGTDTTEFIEIYNGSNHAIDMTTLAVVLVNGTSSLEYARVKLDTAGSIAAGQYLVIKSSNVLSDPGALTILFPATDNQIQNGAPDGVALVDTASVRVIDALSYEGAILDASMTGFPTLQNLVEGTLLPASVADSNTMPGSLVRLPNGSDTNDAADDWKFTTTPTPGTANQ